MESNSKETLAAYLQERGVLKTPAIIDVFLAIDRKDFVPQNMQEYAYADEALPIGEGQTISQPYTVAFMLELLDPKPGNSILDAGAGSGWQSAILAYIVSQNGLKLKFSAKGGSASGGKNEKFFKNGKVYAIERIPFLCEFGKKNVSKYNFISKGIVEWQCGDASIPPNDILFDRIISAASISCDKEDKVECLPFAWRKQLKEGGIMVVPIGSSLWRFIKTGPDRFEEQEYSGFLFVPFISKK